MSEIINLQNEIIELTTVLNENANLYYNGKTPMLSDSTYDILLDNLKGLEEQASFQLPNSPNKRIGYTVLDSIPKKTLPRKMLSLDKVKNDTSKIVNWIKGQPAILSLKLDGLSCMLEYKEGELIGCYTRGNGTIGSDVTDMVKTLTSVPSYLKNKDTVLITGEIIINQNDFYNINSNRKENDLSTFANARNLASGTLLSLDTKLGRDRRLQFVAFDVVQGNLSGKTQNECKTQNDKMQNLKYQGFSVVRYDLLNGYETVIDISNLIEQQKESAEQEGFPYDGMVMTYGNLDYRNSCKPTDRFPTHSIAYKFDDEYAETVLRDIEWSISRNGILTPVAIFDTVELEGTEVSQASVHNVSILRALELGIGDTIKVIKANQIIPQIMENMTKSDTYELPNECPECGSDVLITGDNTLLAKCTNKICSGRQRLEIVHFLSKEALDIKGVSEKIIERLISVGEVKTIYDVLELPQRREELIKKNYPSMGVKTINNITRSIEEGSKTTLDRLLIGLGLEGVGRRVAKDIAIKYQTVDELFNATIDGFKTINGIDSTARSIYNSIQANREHIEKLLEYITFDQQDTVNLSNKLEGLIFVFTGKTKEFVNRKEVEKFIIDNGGKMAGSVSSKTNYLICNGVESSSKYKKAEELNIPIITDTQLTEMIK